MLTCLLTGTMSGCPAAGPPSSRSGDTAAYLIGTMWEGASVGKGHEGV